MFTEKFQVVLHEDCVRFGGRQEYPDGWVGHEAVPPAIAGSEDKVAKAIAIYRASAPVTRERLLYINFGKPFVGKDERGRPKAKTDKKHGMWIPSWLLKPASVAI